MLNRPPGAIPVEAYKKEIDVPEVYFATQAVKLARLQALKEAKGSIVTPDQLKEVNSDSPIKIIVF